jgi:hypothetical protein
MRRSRVATWISVAILAVLIGGCVIQPIQPTQGGATVPAPPAAAQAFAAPEGALISVSAASAPTLDGVADEAAWTEAPALEVRLTRGANTREIMATLQSVYSGDQVFFLVSYADPTESFQRSPWEKQADGSWVMLEDPDDQGGDNNVYYEDKLSFIWPIDFSIPDFESEGCWTACHRGEDPKPYGNKYTEAEGQTGDIWHWKSVRNVNQIDDQFLDHTRWSPETPNAGRKSDANDGGGYKDNMTEDKSAPAFMPPGGGSKDGAPGFILDEEKVEFDDSLFAPGDMVPSIVVAPFLGDRGDISAGWQYADGVWTIELGRALETGSDRDVQFPDLAATYFFGFAVFDNAQVRHSFHNGSIPFVFQP